MTIAVSRTSDIVSLIIGRGLPTGYEMVFPCVGTDRDLQPAFDRQKLMNAPEPVLGGIWTAICMLERVNNDDTIELKKILDNFDPRSPMEIKYTEEEERYVHERRIERIQQQCHREIDPIKDCWKEVCNEMSDRVNFAILNAVKLLGLKCYEDGERRYEKFAEMREDNKMKLMKDIYHNKIYNR